MKTELISLYFMDDSTGGIAILEDGTRVYWIESLPMTVIKYPDSKIERVDERFFIDFRYYFKHPILDRANEIGTTRGYDINREGLLPEENEFNNIIKLVGSKASLVTKDSLSDDIYDLINRKRKENYNGELKDKLEKFKKLTGRKPGFAESIAHRLRKLCE